MAKPIGLAPQEPKQPQEEAKPQAGREKPNLLEAFYANLSEKTMQESSLYGDSQYKPYNPDPIVKKDQAYRIYEDMLDDDQVDVALQLKKDLVLGSGWKISEAPPQIEQDLVAALDDEPDRDLESQIEEILTAYEFGFSVSEKVFKKREDGTLRLDAIRTRHPATWIIPTDKQGQIEAFEQIGVEGKTIKPDPRSLIHFVNRPRFQNPYGRSDLRSAHAAWFAKTQVIRFYAIYLESAAKPIPVARYDENVPSTTIDKIHNVLKKFQASTTLTIPKALEVEFLEAKTNGEAYTKGINLFNMFIGRSLLIPDLLGFQGSETGGGSYSLGKEQFQIFFRHILRRRRAIERVVNRHFIQPIVLWNYGPQEKMPKFELRPISDDDAVKFADIWLKAVNGGSYLPNDDEVNHFRNMIKFPEGPVKPPAGAAPAGGQGPLLRPGGAPGAPGGGGLLKPPPAGAKSMEQDEDQIDEEEGQAKAGEGKPKAKPKAFSLYRLPPGDYHRKVDFRAIGRKMDSGLSAIVLGTKPLIRDAVASLKQQVRELRIVQEADIAAVSELRVPGAKKIGKEINSELRSVFSDAFQEGAHELDRRKDHAAPLPAEKFMDFLEAESMQYVGDWEYEISQRLRLKLQAAIKDGTPMEAVLDEFAEEAFDYSDESMERYARTKLTEVMNRGRLAHFEDSGVVQGYQYSAVLDDRTSEICEGLDGKTFKSGDEPIPPLHFNCRSLLVPITIYEDLEPDQEAGGYPIGRFIEEFKGKDFPTR